MRRLRLVAGRAVQSPARGQRGLDLVIVDPGGALAPHEGLIRDLVQATYDQVRDQIPVDPVTIEVSTDLSLTIAGYGIGGFAPDAFRTRIGIDPGLSDVANTLRERLPVIVAHELHHTARWREPGYGTTLLESMVS
jgi:hypothetical protein